MQKIVGAKYNSKPVEVEIFKSGVDVVVSCTETEEINPETNELATVWICDVNRYTLYEYVLYQQSKFNEIQKDVTQTQVGLIEVYELLLGGGEV